MLETLAIGVAASGLASGAELGVSYAVGEARDRIENILKRDQFAEEVGNLAKELNISLRDAVIEACSEFNEDRINTEHIENEWSEIATEIETENIFFESDEEAVAHIANGIVVTLGIDPDSEPNKREAIEIAVAEAYHEAIRSFADRVSNTELETLFLTEANIHLSKAARRLEDNLSTIQYQLSRYEDKALLDEGFVRLDPLYFERIEPIDPTIAWRTGFDFAEVAAGFPLDRQQPSTNNTPERKSLSSNIRNHLLDEGNVVVLGAGGSGKSTVCKSVAYQWYACDIGSVFYREGQVGSFDSPGTLIDALHATDEIPLVVAEDAVTEATKQIYKVMEAIPDSDAAFLIDARRSEWEESGNLLTNARLEHQRQSMNVVSMPAFDKTECRRMVKHYERVNGTSSDKTVEELYREARDAEIGAPLLIAYYLSGITDAKSSISALEMDVRNAYSEYFSWTNEDFLQQTVAALISILNITEIPISPHYIYALGEEKDEYRKISRSLDRLNGLMFLKTNSDDSEFRMYHEIWYALFLEYLLEDRSGKLATELFESCINSLFRLVDNPERQSKISDWLRTQSLRISPIKNEPTKAANRLVKQAAQVGLRYPVTAPLFSTYDMSKIELPSVCSSDTELDWINRRGEMYFKKGNLKRAYSELTKFDRIESEIDASGSTETQHHRAKNNLLIGKVEHDRANYERSSVALQQAKDIFQNIGKATQQAEAMLWSGHVALSQSNIEIARDRYQRSLSISPDEATKLRADCHNGLGLAASNVGKLTEARRHYTVSRNLYQSVQNKRREAVVLNNLGFFHRHVDPEDAEAHLHTGLQLITQVGGDYIKSKIMSNLAIVSIIQADIETAEEFNHKTLSLRRQIDDKKGVASSLITKSAIARESGNPDGGREYLKQSLSILDEIGNKKRKSRALYEFARIELCVNNLTEAKQRAREGLVAANNINDRARRGQLYRLLGRIAAQDSQTGDSVFYLYRSLDIFDGLDATWEFDRTVSLIKEYCELSDESDDYTKLKQHFTVT